METLYSIVVMPPSPCTNRRCCIVSPVKGWGSIATENGYVIIEPLSARPRYRVVYPDGVIVRSAADIDDSDFVRVIAKGETVEGTGQVQMFDNVERIQVCVLWLYSYYLVNRSINNDRCFQPISISAFELIFNWK